MISRAVLDFVGLPILLPSALEVRLRRVSFKDDGSVIDDGSRSGEVQRNCHRFILEKGDNVKRSVARTTSLLVEEGYEIGDMSMIQHIAHHEWRHGILSARRKQLRVKKPEVRMYVRALGFDVVGAGELAVGLGLATITPKGVTVTAKSSIKLLPGDSIGLACSALNMAADRLGCERIHDESFSLLETVGKRLFTDSAVENRMKQWVEWSATSRMPLQIAQALDFAQRVTIEAFQPIPVSAMPTDSMRSVN